MKTIVINLYQFAELNEAAKALAICEHGAFLLSIGQEVEQANGELETEYSDTIEDAEVIESIEANEYLFFKNGEMASVTHFTGKHPRTGQTELKLHGETYNVI